MLETQPECRINARITFANLNLTIEQTDGGKKLSNGINVTFTFSIQAMQCVPACLGGFLLDRCMLRFSLFIREQSQLSFSILITVSILKGQFSLHKHLEVIKLKGQGEDKTKDNMPPAGINFLEQNILPVSPTLRHQGLSTQEQNVLSFIVITQAK